MRSETSAENRKAVDLGAGGSLPPTHIQSHAWLEGRRAWHVARRNRRIRSTHLRGVEVAPLYLPLNASFECFLSIVQVWVWPFVVVKKLLTSENSLAQWLCEIELGGLLIKTYAKNKKSQDNHHVRS